MKKFLSIVVSLFILISFTSVSADYVTYYDVINDVKLLLGEDPDAAWEMSPDAAKSAASNLEGFTCRDTGEDTVVCERTHWSGEFQITLYFSENKFAAAACEFTAPSLQDLNYQPGTAYIYNTEDLINRLKLAGLIPADAAENQDKNLIDGSEIFPYGSVYKIDSSSLLQVGYHSKTASDPKFRMIFLVSSENYSPEISFAEDDPEGSAADEKAYIGSWEMDSYYLVGEDGFPSMIYSKRVWNLFLNFDSMSIILLDSGNVMQEKILNQNLDVKFGTWTVDDQGVNITLENGDNFHSCTINDDRMICPVTDNGKLYAKMEFANEGLTESELNAKFIMYGFIMAMNSSGSIASVTVKSPDSVNITMSVSKNETIAGDSLKIEVSAPGAEGIKVYSGFNKIPDSGPSEMAFKEGTGESLSFYGGFDTPGTWYLYAIASYDGVWSDQKSNVESITVKERNSNDIIGRWVLHDISEDIFSEQPKTFSKDFRNTSLGLDSQELIFNEDFSFERINILDGESTVEKGTWSLDNNILRVDIAGQKESFDISSNWIYSSLKTGDIVSRLSYLRK